MKLYFDGNGNWAGTQSDAKRLHGVINPVEVPTDKQGLLDWLNNSQIGKSPTPAEAPQPHYNPDTRPSRWTDIKDAAEKASFKDWGVALAVLMNRLDEIADKEL